MKIRNGFVSNSSSSSFVVAIKKSDNVCPHCGRGDPNILGMIEQDHSSCETEMEGIGIDVVLEFADGLCKYDDYHKKTANEIKEKAAKYENEWELAVFSISYHNETLNQMIEESISAGTIEVIYKG